MNFQIKAFAICAATLMALIQTPIAAQAEQIRTATEYSISFAGIPVARSKFKTILDGNSITVTGALATSGLVAVFDSTKATSTSEGVISKNGVQSQSFALDYKSGKKVRATRVSFKNGNVASTSITPERAPNPNNVPIKPGDLKGVVDPFLASLVLATARSEVCNRTIKVFDGVLRINLVLRPSGSEPYVIGAIKGDGVRCAARYEPVSGHRASSSSVSYMAEGERATIVFGQLEGTDLFAPVKAAIKTKNGTVTIRATRFERTVE